MRFRGSVGFGGEIGGRRERCFACGEGEAGGWSGRRRRGRWWKVVVVVGGVGADGEVVEDAGRTLFAKTVWRGPGTYSNSEGGSKFEVALVVGLDQA